MTMKEIQKTKEEFVHLHLHTEFSPLDGMNRANELAKHISKNGGTACAITDHGNMSGTYEFYKAMRAQGVKPILGCEVYTSSLEGELKAYHMVLLAKTYEGYKNLMKIVESSHHEGNFYKKPQVRLDDNTLERYNDGVIALSGCIGGAIPQAIASGDFAKAVEIATYFQGIYGEDFYLEIQCHGLGEREEYINSALIQIGNELGIEIVSTGDAHYLRKEDKAAHDVLLAIATKKVVEEEKAFALEGTGYHVLTTEEAWDLFGFMPKSIENTRIIADKCNVEIPVGEVDLPTFSVPDDFDNEKSYLEHLAQEGFKNRFKNSSKATDETYHKRFDYEMSVINKMGFPGYFLVVADYISFAREQEIYVGPGRGSAAGSLVAYCLGITDLDPVEFDLLFERFLNPDRISMPDIDTDFEHSRRGEVQDYIRQKYGAENVSGIITFGTLAAKQVCKDVARALGHEVAMGERLSKMIPSEPKMTIAKALELNKEFKDLVDSDASVAKIITIAQSLEGLKRHASQHACGMIIAPHAVSDFVPVSKLQGEWVGNMTWLSVRKRGC